ncbi:MAG TPA: lycopene cyclase domain-containing protein [Chthoniobacterales bacterium]
MTYGSFHLRFNLPLLALAGCISLFGAWRPWVLLTFGLVLLIVVAFTTPWDNYAVAHGMWDFPDSRYAFRIWHLPVEEYCFFVLQGLEVMLVCHGLSGLFGFWKPGIPGFGSLPVRLGLGTLLLLWALVGFWATRRLPRRGHYLFHLVYWFGPVLVLQWLLAGPLLVANGFAVTIATVLVGTWLTLADLAAVRRGLWIFDDRQILGLRWRQSLPVEEIMFFYVTSLLVAQSYFMLGPVASKWLKSL